jgi:hypothetical protein
MASSLVDIEKGKLIYNTALNLKSHNDKPIKVVSIIGKARTGKSTFLNCLLTYWKSDSQHIFTMSDSCVHCTNGIDIYNIEDCGIILLDFQGIYLGNSSNDPKLLLLAYLVSDIIIFNEVKMLSNITLQQFEPMLSFINYLKGKNDLKDFNPKLVFRISDMNLEIDPTSNMQDMLHDEDDQFQAIRECIIELFDTPYAVCTKNLDRGEFKLLRENNFRDLLDNPENGFLEAITNINKYLECCEFRKTASLFLTDLPKIVSCINEEKAIDFTKLDIVKAISDTQIRDWIDALGTEIYNEIKVDGTSNTYKKVIERMETRDRIIRDIEKTFKSIPKTIRDARTASIRQKIDTVIAKADARNTEQANKLMEKIISSHLLAPTPFNLSIRFENLEKINFDEWIKPFVDKLEAIKQAGEHLHNSAVVPFCEWKIKIINDLKSRFKAELKEVRDVLDRKEKESEELIDDMEKNLESIINKFIKDESLDSPYSIVLDQINNEYIIKLNSLLESSNLNCRNIKQFKFLCQTLPVFYNGGCVIEKTINYLKVLLPKVGSFNSDFLAIKNKYTARINKILSSKGIDLIAKYRTAAFTEKGYIEFTTCRFDCNYVGITYDGRHKSITFINNPKTKFIEFNPLKKRKTHHSNEYHEMENIIPAIMTEDYYKLTLEPILLRTCKHLASKDYVYDETVPELNGWLKFLKDITDIEIPKPGIKVFVISFDFYRNMNEDDYKKLALLEIFEIRFKKELCKKVSS